MARRPRRRINLPPHLRARREDEHSGDETPVPSTENLVIGIDAGSNGVTAIQLQSREISLDSVAGVRVIEDDSIDPDTFIMLPPVRLSTDLNFSQLEERIRRRMQEANARNMPSISGIQYVGRGTRSFQAQARGAGRAGSRFFRNLAADELLRQTLSDEELLNQVKAIFTKADHLADFVYNHQQYISNLDHLVFANKEYQIAVLTRLKRHDLVKFCKDNKISMPTLQAQTMRVPQMVQHIVKSCRQIKEKLNYRETGEGRVRTSLQVGEFRRYLSYEQAYLSSFHAIAMPREELPTETIEDVIKEIAAMEKQTLVAGVGQMLRNIHTGDAVEVAVDRNVEKGSITFEVKIEIDVDRPLTAYSHGSASVFEQLRDLELRELTKDQIIMLMADTVLADEIPDDKTRMNFLRQISVAVLDNLTEDATTIDCTRTVQDVLNRTVRLRNKYRKKRIKIRTK